MIFIYVKYVFVFITILTAGVGSHPKINESKYDKIRNISNQKNDKDNCWMDLKSERQFQAMDDLDAQYFSTRENYQIEIGDNFEKQLMSSLLVNQGAAERELHQVDGIRKYIPAGLNLGGYCMMRLPKSVLFLHRMKLRNQTNFRVNYLHLDWANMALVARLSLNDLHLLGAYERSNTDRDPSVLYYIPSFGELQILMKDVNYKMEGRLRLINNRLLIELVNSDILTNDILMMYVKDNEIAEANKIQRHNIEEFVSRLKCDLDLWLKDFFNDYLMYNSDFKPTPNNENFLQYEKKKTALANEYADFVIEGIKKRLNKFQATSVKMPHFTIYSVMNMQIKLHNGNLRGLDSIYRRSVATTKKTDKIRKIEAIVGFSQLKAEYQYDAVVGNGMPPLRGNIILSGDELTAHLEISQMSQPDTLDISLDDFVQTTPESLTVEGPGNRVIANFKQILEHAIVAIMSNSMIYNVNMLKSLTRCEPSLHGNDKNKPNADNYNSTEDNGDDDELEKINDDDDIDKDNKLLPEDQTDDGSKNRSSGDNGDNNEPDEDYNDNDDSNDKENKLPTEDENENRSTDRDTGDNGDNDVNFEPDDEDNDKQSQSADQSDYRILPSESKEDNKNRSSLAANVPKDADYFLTKNDSVEIEVPVNGKVETMKINSYNEFKLKKIKKPNDRGTGGNSDNDGNYDPDDNHSDNIKISESEDQTDISPNDRVTVDSGDSNYQSDNNDDKQRDNDNNSQREDESDNGDSLSDSKGQATDKSNLAVDVVLKDADYFLTKNDSVEVEVPVNGNLEKYKINSYNDFKVKKINK